MMYRACTVLLLSSQGNSECGSPSDPRVSAEVEDLGKEMQVREASLLVTGRAGIETDSPTWHPPPWPLSPRHCRPQGTFHPLEDLCLQPSCQALPEPTVSLQPQKSQARALSLKVQALEKMVASREHKATDAARALQATAQAMLHKTEPLTQVGSCPLRQAPGGWGVLSLGGRGVVEERERQRLEIVLPIRPVSPACSTPRPAFLFSLQLRQEARAALTRASSSVQAATVTVTGARTLLADLEGTQALLSPRLLDAQMPVTAIHTPPQPGQLGPGDKKGTEVQMWGHKPRSPFPTPHPQPGPLPQPLVSLSHTTHGCLAHVAVSHPTICTTRQGEMGRESDALGCPSLV